MLRSDRNFSFNIRPAERTEEIRLGGLDQQDSARHPVLVRPFQKGLVSARFFSWKRRKSHAATANKNAHRDCQKELEGSANGRIVGLRFHRLTNFLPEYWGNQGVCRASCARAWPDWNAADCVAVQTSRKAPNTREGSKFQIPKKLQFPNSKLRRARLIQCLEFEVWDFSGTWGLGFGALPDHELLTTDHE